MRKLIIKTSVLFTGEEVINKPMCVVINNDKIETIDDQKELGRDIEGECIQTNFLMPGLIDMHVHITGYKEGSLRGNPFEPMKKFLKLALCNGITTLRDTGNHLETIMYLKRWILKNDGSMIYSSGPLLDKPPVIWPSTRIITSKEEAIMQVNNLFIEGVDLIKVYVNTTPDLLKVIIEEAHKKGLKVAGDIHATGPIDAINFKIDTIEHIVNLIDESFVKNLNKNYLSEKKGMIKKLMLFSDVDLHSDKIKLLLDMLNKNNTYICPTFLVLKRNCFIEEMFEEPYLDYMIPIMPYHKYFKFMRNPMGRFFGRKHMIKHFPHMSLSPQEKEKLKNGFYKIIEFIKMLSENGINMIMGTDSPNPSIVPGFSLHEEMKLYQDAGIEPIEILKSATSLSARVLENKNIGVIKEDNMANLLLLKSNPLTDIYRISTIEYIILKGKLLKREDLLREFETISKMER